jgi:hypothetical protein
MFLLDGTVRLLGAGNTDYLDILCEPECLDPVLRLLVDYLSNREYDFMDLPSSSPLLAMDGPASKCSVCPVLQLNEVKMSRKLLANLEDARHYLERDGEFSIESAAEGSVSEMIDALIHLHEARWTQKGQAGVLHSEEVRRFHRSAAPALLQAGLLRLYGLRHRGKWAAVHYCLSAHGRTYYYLGGFDPSMASRSPGNLLIQHSITKAVECGDREYDFLRGQEENKYRWGAQDTATFRLQGHVAARKPGTGEHSAPFAESEACPRFAPHREPTAGIRRRRPAIPFRKMRHLFAFIDSCAFVFIRGPFRKMRCLFARERTPDSHKRTALLVTPSLLHDENQSLSGLSKAGR